MLKIYYHRSVLKSEHHLVKIEVSQNLMLLETSSGSILKYFLKHQKYNLKGKALNVHDKQIY